MNGRTRQPRLTSEEAATSQQVRDQVAQELPNLIARHQERKTQSRDGSDARIDSPPDPTKMPTD